jgi:Fungal protein kinase
LFNIILTDPKQNRGCSGMLIDLDLAVLVGEDGKNETSEERNMTGTLEYMAIQILEGAVRKETAGTDHTYRHDLDSFFYVFLSRCIGRRGSILV